MTTLGRKAPFKLPPLRPAAQWRDRLVQVLRNLIANAQSFSPSRGRIAVSAHEAGGMAEISVEDEGPGIPDGNLEHVFEREPARDRQPGVGRAVRGDAAAGVAGLRSAMPFARIALLLGQGGNPSHTPGN
jgi:sensor histidine kinase regulating citrate/malate metabolism